jgi:ribosomal protein S1
MNSSSPDNPSPDSGPSSLTPEVLAEIDAAMKDMDHLNEPIMGRGVVHDPKPNLAASARPAGTRGPRVVQAGREHRIGKIVSVGPSDIFLEFGPKELGVLPRVQFQEGDALPVVGAEFEVVVDKFEPGEGLFLCSRPGQVQKAAWEQLEPGQVVEARVTGVSKGGLELEVAEHKAFMPASQVSIDRVPDLSVFVGEKLKCRITRVERVGRGNIVLSRRDILDEERRASAEKIKASLSEGQTVEGTVRKVMPFGAFIDIGGLDGLVHISDLTYDRVNFGEKFVEKYVQEGQRVQARVLKIDWENNRLSLGLKQVQGDPFVTAAEAITESAEINGKVVRVAEFGAFVELAPGVEGLVHISELDHKRVARVEDAVKVDEIVRVKVLKIDRDSRRVSLSVKALKPMPEMNIGGGGGGQGDRPGRKRGEQGRPIEEITKVTPALRRMREKSKNVNFKGGLS